jgi:hypothetical protein
MKKKRFVGEQRIAIVQGILCIVLILVVLQLWLFTATMEAYLGGENSILLPAAFSSMICLALNGGLLIYLYKIDERS